MALLKIFRNTKFIYLSSSSDRTFFVIEDWAFLKKKLKNLERGKNIQHNSEPIHFHTHYYVLHIVDCTIQAFEF